jgi:mono/diheme cytochrome c family protein
MYKAVFYLIIILLTGSCSGNEDSGNKQFPKSGINSGYDTLGLGKETFEEKCVVCHGNDGRLGISGAKILPDTKLQMDGIIKQIQNGKKAMPSFKQVLTEEQITAVAKYVLTLKDTIN